MIEALISAVNANYYHLAMDNQETHALIAGTLALITHYAESRRPEGGARWSLLEKRR